jgi:hypothetical protein
LKTFKAKDNDGTLAILHACDEPMQGTFVGEHDDGVVVAKGIVRPPLVTKDGRVEEEAHVEEAAFSKKLNDVSEGTFYKVQKVGKRNCGFSYQTALFSLKNPEHMIDHDTERFENMTATDMLSPEAAKKVQCGVPINFLLNEMTPWNLVTSFKEDGVRATCYASELVPRGDDSYHQINTSVKDAFAKAGVQVTDETHVFWDTSWFMMLPDSAGLLCKQLGCKPKDLYDMEFLIHRDPALPDGTDLYVAKYAGMLKWANSEKGHGIVVHPQDSNWAAAGGDFDGDDATVYVKQPYMEPHGRVPRPNYRSTGNMYVTDSVADQMIEACSNTTPTMLGQSILGLMRLVERGLGDDANRALGAAVAQAAVDAKKHPVNHEAVGNANRLVMQQIQEGRDTNPEYLSDYINHMRRAKSVLGKMQVWGELCSLIDEGYWVDGSPIEQALVRRINALRRIFDEVNWYLELNNQNLPQTLRNAAVAATKNSALVNAVKSITQDYVTAATKLAFFDKDDKDGAIYKDDVNTARQSVQMAAVSGIVGSVKVSPKEAQIALIGYGPQRLAAQFVPSETFEALMGDTKYLTLALKSTGWQSGVYYTDDIQPIKACERHWESFKQGLSDTVSLMVIGEGPNSTRVRLTSP